MTLTAKDEKGKKLVQKYSCYIGSSSVMYSYIEAGGRVILPMTTLLNILRYIP